MCLICTVFGHKYTNVDVAEEAFCVRCGFHRPAMVWPRISSPKLPEPKEYPPMPEVKMPQVAISDVDLVQSSTMVELTPMAFNLSILENELSSLDRMIIKANDDLAKVTRRLDDLYKRRSVAKARMKAYMNDWWSERK